MKANELMVKDWVCCNGEPCRVWMIDWQYRLVRCHHNGSEWMCGTEEITPIELTDNILLESGFKILYDSSVSMKFRATNDEDDAFVYLTFYKKSDDCRIYLEIESKTTIINSTNTNFVHELQHILRICGMNDIDDRLKVI